MAPQTMAEKARAKLQAVLDNPNRNDATSYKQRVMTTTTPATGSDWTNTWVRRSSNDRRASVGSEGSGGSPVRRRSSFQEWLYPSAR
ncbi:hypothetical protein NW752_012092 [Fusarium irregulare]|uniref:Uncharacterized protein n=1 Tax=Fusarium irregulare TaxID=2494466 RepID=A0A9W8U565_9HYPO|nr:hypothetical protein NW752_012092 [Fusarium irregulare]KAJ4006568.1 hypothetical protein NW766_010663 [Fusarium irregulare]